MTLCLPVLWRLFPGHENLLPAYFEGEAHDLDDAWGPTLPKSTRAGAFAQPGGFPYDVG